MSLDPLIFPSQAAPNQVEAKGDLGLVKGHAYSVTGATTVRLICLDKYIVFVPSVNPLSGVWSQKWKLNNWQKTTLFTLV